MNDLLDDFSLFASEAGSTNPATGLPMIGCLDLAGNPYGCSHQNHVTWNDHPNLASIFHDEFL